MATNGTLSLDNTLGAVFLGYSISSILYGVTLVQAFIYATSSRRSSDSRSLQTFVLTLFVFDSAHTALSMIGMYRVFISGPSDADAFADGIEMIDEEAAFGLLMIFLAQLYFARRAWAMGSSARFPRVLRLIVPITITILSIFGCAVNSVITVKALQHRKQATLPTTPNIDNSFTLWWRLSFASTIACNIIIASSMFAVLRRARAGLPRSSILILITLFTVNTGLVTTLLTIAAMIQYLVKPSILIYVGLELLIPKSYCNSVLAALNARDYLKEKVTEADSTQEFLPVFAASSKGPRMYTSNISDEGHIIPSNDVCEKRSHLQPPTIEWQPPTRTPSPIVFAERPLRTQLYQPEDI